MKVLLIIVGTNSQGITATQRQLAEAGEGLRDYLLYEALDAEIIDYHRMRSETGVYKQLFRILPKPWVIALYAFRRRRQADVLVTWSEQASLFLAFLQWVTRDRTPHVALLYWMSKAVVRYPLWAFGGTIARIVTWSSVQRDYAIKNLGIAAERISFVRHFVDEHFWQRRTQDSEDARLICAAGSEMRDYPTLIAAVTGLDVRCHIASGEIRITSGYRAKYVYPDDFAASLPANMTMGPMPLAQMRQLYEQAAIVVVPVKPSDTDNGINVILESMAMSKAIICSRTRGQVDAIEDGVTGIYVEPENPEALREAIVALLKDPQKRERLGKQARAYVETHHRMGQFVAGVKTAVERAAAETKRRR